MCPDCGEALVIYELDGVEIDRCLSCGGTWLDAGELELIVERAGADVERLVDAVETARHIRKSKRRCPRCNTKMRTLAVGDTDTIELESCARGHGLWLDKGEMRSLILAHAESEEGAVARFFGDLYRHEVETESKGD